MTKKAKTISVLEKKLEKLESLCEAFTFNDNNANLYREIVLRVLFAKTLLTAEIASRPTDMEGEEDSEERLKFACMAKRLNEIEEAFKTNQFSGQDDGSVTEPETGSLETNDGVVDGETGSVYSWAESCQIEVGKAEEEKKEEEDAERWLLFEDASSEEKMDVRVPATTAEKEEEVVGVVREVKEKGRVGFRALVCFALIGLVGGMISFFGYIGDNMKEDIFFPTPT